MRQFIIPYLTYKNSLEAANYYKEILDGEIVYVMLGKDTPNCPEDELDKVQHLELKVNDNFIYFADGKQFPSDQNLTMLNYDNLDKLKEAYEKMKLTSKIIRKLEKTFWDAYYGILQDKYGIKWLFHYMNPKE